MKKAEFVARLYSGKFVTIKGFALECNGVQLVAHRCINDATGNQGGAGSWWLASEPQSGLKFSRPVRTLAEVKAAAIERFEQYGEARVRDVVRRAIETNNIAKIRGQE